MRHTRSHHGKEDLDRTDTPQAKANETSMDDNNGKRIKYRGKKKQHQKASK